MAMFTESLVGEGFPCLKIPRGEIKPDGASRQTDHILDSGLFGVACISLLGAVSRV